MNELFHGRMKSCPPNIGFIDRDTVMPISGKPLQLEFLDDVYIHQRDCGGTLEPGGMYEFMLEQDPVRGEGCFRAKGARRIEVLQAIDIQERRCSANPRCNEPPTTALVRFDPLRVEYHHVHQAKYMPPELAAQVVANHPFREMFSSIRNAEDDGRVICQGPEQLVELCNAYLRRKFAHLVNNCDIPCDISTFDEQTRRDADNLMSEVIEDNRDFGAVDQAQYLEAEYRRYLVAVNLLQWVVSSKVITRGMEVGPETIAGIFTLIEHELPNEPRVLIQRCEETQGLLGFLAKEDLLSPYSVLPMRYLPEIFMACPVIFHIAGPDETKLAEERWKENDPRISPFTKYMCQRLPGNERWADLFQVFNRRERPMSLYKQCEAIPRHIRGIIKAARQFFTHVAIFTPYHDICGDEWGNPEWIRSLDPYVIGFKNSLPCFVVLGRYSDSGIMPLFHELVADTMNFLGRHHDRLLRFNNVDRPYWFRQGPNYRENGYFNSHRSSVAAFGTGTYLVRFAQDVLRAYRECKLFDWIREEADLEPQNEDHRLIEHEHTEGTLPVS